MIFLVHNAGGYFRNIVQILFGNKSWVGYFCNENSSKLPVIRKGVLNPSDAFPKRTLDNEMKTRLNLSYARDYKIKNDLNILVKGIRELGR